MVPKLEFFGNNMNIIEGTDNWIKLYLFYFNRIKKNIDKWNWYERN